MSVVLFMLLLSVGNCQALLLFEHLGFDLSNNSYIFYNDIGDGDHALKCVTESVNCCNNSDIGGWRDESGRPVYQGSDGTTCLYVTRGYGVISLRRKRGCSDHTSGLWRCDIPDSSGDIQSLYIYIGYERYSNPPGQLNNSVSMNFTLHTELRASVPEFTISCHTHGGPATTVQWTVNGVPGQEDRYHETSQLILDTSLNPVYDNRLRVRGRRNGTYNCTISNNIRDYLDEYNESVTKVDGNLDISVAGEPTGLTAVISESISTHVNITVSWESPGDPVTGYVSVTQVNRTLNISVAVEPSNLTAIISESNSTHVNITVSWGDPVTGYVIYYQPKGGPVISDRVSGGETDTHSLDGLQRGVTYYISIVALSPHLPSPLVGPITVISDQLLIYVETSPESLITSPNNQFSVYCTARAEVDGQSVPVDIEWTRRDFFSQSGPSELMPTLYTTTGSPERGYQSVLTTSEDDTVNTIIYRCTATVSSHSSFNDTTVYVKAIAPRLSTTAVTSSTIAQSISDGGNDEDTHSTLMSTTSSIAKTNNGNFDPISPTASSSITYQEDHSLSSSATTVSASPTSPTTLTNETATDSEVRQNTSSGIIAGIASAAAIITLISIAGCVFSLVRMKMRESNVPRSKFESISYKRPSRLERLEVGRREDNITSNVLSTENDSLFDEDIPVRSDIPVSEFPDYVLDMTVENQRDKSKLAIEYQQFNDVPTLTFEEACLSHNIDLNRFRNIYPYDTSRVTLKGIPGELGSDYINASFISGYGGNKYIAAQAPLNETIDHFWRMVWEYEIEAIVMLTKCVEMTREKSAQYWPESLSETITPGDRLSITLSSSTPYAEYHVRKLLVRHLTEQDKSVTVTQFHYTAWPDHGVPNNVMSVIRFIRHVRKLFPAASQDQPLLVHCSAGVGRTGTFITLDMMMQQMKAEATLSVCQCVRNLRTQRMKMVQTPAQYEFIHQALSELVVCGETEVTASSLRSFTESLRDPVTDSRPTLSLQHLKVLEDLSTQQRCDFTGAKAEANISKNRFPDKLPSEVYRVSLAGSSGSEYINASFINGYKQRDAYIATQGPLEGTVEDFWRMMWEYQCGCIVMLCQLEEDGQKSSYPYWPGEEGEEMVCGRLSVRLVKVRGHGDIVERRMEVKENKSISPDILHVKMVQLTSWPLEGLPHPTAIISLIDKLNHVLMSTSSKQTVVMCSDGVVRSGTFLVIHSQLERLKTEGVVDVFQAIKSARIHRPGVIPNTDHYVFCYEVLADFVERMEAYHNFKTLM